MAWGRALRRTDTVPLTFRVRHWPAVNRAYADHLSGFADHRPARTVVPCGALHYGFDVEIDAIAAVKELGSARSSISTMSVITAILPIALLLVLVTLPRPRGRFPLSAHVALPIAAMSAYGLRLISPHEGNHEVIEGSSAS